MLRPSQNATPPRSPSMYPQPTLGIRLVLLLNYITTCVAVEDFDSRIDLDYRHVVVSFCDASDLFQQWRINSTENMVYLAHPNRCMSLAPNAVDLSFPCPSASMPKGGDQSFRIDSNSGGQYRLNHDCFESDREYGNWGLTKYEDHANVVTRKCHDKIGSGDKNDSHEQAQLLVGLLKKPTFIFDNSSELGLLVNIQTSKCVQVGGDMMMQCMEMYDTKGLRPGINDYISPSVYPTYLYPCGKGCRPKDVQSWMSTPISSTSTFSLLRLRNDPRLCLRSGINTDVVQSWSQSQVVEVFLLSTLFLIACLMFEHWRGPRLPRGKKDATHNGEDVDAKIHLLFSRTLFWMTMRLLLAMTGPIMLSSVYILNLTNIRGGRSYYARTMTVHGTLISITALFAHVLLIARRTTPDPEEEEDGVGNEGSVGEDGEKNEMDNLESNNQNKMQPFSRPPCLRRFVQMIINSAKWCSSKIVGMSLFCGNYPSVIWHAALVYWPRGYDSYTATQASTWSGLFYILGMPITVSAFWQVVTSAADSNVGHNKNYAVEVSWRWTKIMLAQWCVLVSTLFGPDGTPSDTSGVSSNILVLGVTAEVVLATRRSFTVRNLFQEKHLLIVAVFCIPLILLSLYEIVGMVVSNRSTYGSSGMTGYGAVGGDSNQVRGSTAYGWWFGPYARNIAYFQWFCYLVIMYCLNFSVTITKWCNSGVRAPAWLADVLEETQGRIPVLADGAEYHFFITKKDGGGEGSGKTLAYAIGRALRDVGFKVWLSQFEVESGRPANVDAMQRGIRKSEMILVILTEGIFHQDRVHVTHTGALFCCFIFSFIAHIEHSLSLLFLCGLHPSFLFSFFFFLFSYRAQIRN